MTLAALLGLGDRELISLVGGGGKSTLLFGLGDEFAAAEKRVILTTTTKMGRGQALFTPTVCWSDDTATIRSALDEAGPVMLLADGNDHKITGPPPETIDRLFSESVADYIVVEADGSRGRPLKAPAEWEPVIPSLTTTVVILMGVDALGRPLSEVTHRIDQGMRFTGLAADHTMTPADCAAILIHPEGALRECPDDARILIALTAVSTPEQNEAAEEIRQLVEPQVSLVVVPADRAR